MFMTLIYSSELSGVDSFDYLVALQRHSDEVAKSPGDWMPWNCWNTLVAEAEANTQGPAS